jgi:transcription termination factor Rho
MNNQKSRNRTSTTKGKSPAGRRRSHRGGQNREVLASELSPCEGVLELHPKGYGFLRCPAKEFARRETDVFVSESTISKLRLRQSVLINGKSTSASKNVGARLIQIDRIEGMNPADYKELLPFDELTPINPKQWLRLERFDEPVDAQAGGPDAMRLLDLLCPIARGQRALIASPPRAGKTTLLKQIGQSISDNYPDVHLVALLIDERPEEVTEIRAELGGEVFASCLDQDIQSHARLSQLVVDRCKRMAEAGKDVFLLVDSLTRMARAFNKLPHLTGPIGAGGLNIRALDIPKQVFASARPFAEGGSLTIVATVLIETENRMDEVIFQEFKGTGNLDLVLSRQIADLRIWPAIDIPKSATRRVELIHDAETMSAVTALRRTLLTMRAEDALKGLAQKLIQVKTNDAFISLINGKMQTN